MKSNVVSALVTGVYCKRWWKKLKKDLSRLNLCKTQKIMIYCKIAKGLVIESTLLADDKYDIKYIESCVADISNTLLDINKVDEVSCDNNN